MLVYWRVIITSDPQGASGPAQRCVARAAATPRRPTPRGTARSTGGEMTRAVVMSWRFLLISREFMMISWRFVMTSRDFMMIYDDVMEISADFKGIYDDFVEICDDFKGFYDDL